MRTTRLAVLVTLVAVLFATQRADALILTGQGNQPVSDPGWPGGALAVANSENRVGWAEGPPFGGGQWTFFYRGRQTDLQKALEAFAAIKADRLEVVLHEGVATSPFLGGGGDDAQNAGYDWSFEVWVPENWNRLYNDPHSFFSADHPNFRQPVASPRLDIWFSPGRLEWGRAEVPAKVIVRDDRATAHGLRPGTGSVIRASVTEAGSAQPVPGARLVVLLSEGGAPWRKASEAVGALQVFAYREGYHQRWNPSDLVQVPGPGAGEPIDHVVRMEATGSVWVQVMDADRKPIRNPREGEVQVHIQATEGPVVGSWGGSSNVGTNGVCVFEGVPPGQYRVSGKPFVPGRDQGEGGAVVVTVEAGKTAHLDLVQP